MADNRIIIEVGVEGDAEVRFKKLTSAITDFSDEGTKSLNKFSGAFDVFAGVLTAEAVLGGIKALAAGAKELFQTLVTDGIAAASEQEDALNKLNTALALSGKYSKETSDSINDLATELQKTTKFSDDQVLSSAALIQSLGRLDKEGLKGATRAAADLSAALGIDLESASRLVGKAAAGEVASFKKFGVAIEEGANKGETFARTLEAINSRFGGAAASQANTYSGAVTQLGNAFGEVKEQIGFVIVGNQSVINVVNTASQIFNELAGTLEENRDGARSFVGEGLVLIIDAMQYVVAGVQAGEVILLKLYQAALIAQTGLSVVADKLTLGFSDAGKRAEESAQKAADLEQAIIDIEKGEGSLDKVNDALERLKNAASAGIGKATEETERLTASSRGAASSIDEITDAQKEMIKNGEKLAEQAADSDPSLEYARRSEALMAALEADKITVEQYYAALDFYEQDRATKASAARTKEAQEIIAQNQLLTQEDLAANQTQILQNQERLRVIIDSEKLTTADKTKLQQQYAQQSAVIENQRRQAITSSIGALSSLQNSKTKELAAVGKAAAIAQATIQTYTGATAAAAALAPIPFVGPALAIAAAAAFITAGLANVAQIVGTPLATGGIIPQGFQNDTFAARLTSNERVLNVAENRDFSRFMENAPSDRALLQSISDRLGSLNNQIIVKIGEREIINEFQSALDSGRRISI